MEVNGAERARQLASAVARIRREWDQVWVERVEEGPALTVAVSSVVRVSAQVHLGSLSPGDVQVELYTGPVGVNSEIMCGRAVPMNPETRVGGACRYVGETSIDRTGRHGFTIRIRPCHPDLTCAFLPGLIRWADSERVEATVRR